MSLLVKTWLAPFDWEFVTEINRGLCKQKNALHKPTSDGHEPARQLWEKSRLTSQKLTDALQVCFQCHRLAPFCFYNGNTFAAIARDFITDLQSHLSPDQAHILRSIAGHVVAGTATDIEVKQLDRILSDLKL
ncbi:MAG: hypothetical protein HY298_24225 [Verrucomicrobia bacterium]|nr:hypothetical protein [Verrucomicrobiota bacterium]